MKFLLDECLPHSFVGRLAQRGYPDAVHPINIGLRGHRDDQLVRRAIDEDRLIVTTNVIDYRKLLGRQELHPGAIMPEALEREPLWSLVEVALAFIELHPDPAGYMVNRVIEVSATEGVRPYELPKGEQT